MRHRSVAFAAILVAALSTSALFAGCSKKDSTSPPVTMTGPTFNFTFPQTGTSHQFTFTDVGTWNYACIPHGSGGMTGTVIVAAAGADSALVQVGPSNAFSYSPSSVTIKQGGKVRWVNASTNTFNHTVTR